MTSNADLLHVLARASEGDPDAERALGRAIAAARLFVPMREDPSAGSSGLWATADQRGRTQVVAFTDAAGVQAWAGAPTPYAVMPGVELCHLASGADADALWIDPGAPHGARLDRRLVDAAGAGVALRSDAP